MKHKAARSINYKLARFAVALTTCLLVGSIGFVLAYYSNDESIDNTMQTATSEMVLNEIFNPSDYWVAGETKLKEVSFENTGEIDQLLRFTVTAVWYEEVTNEDGTVEWVEWTDDEGNSAAASDAVIINYTDYLLGDTDTAAQWTLIDGYYYYNSVIAPGAETDIVIESITFSSSLDNGGYGTSLDYSDKRYSLTVSMEAIEVNVDVAESDWSVTYSDSSGVLTWFLYSGVVPND